MIYNTFSFNWISGFMLGFELIFAEDQPKCACHEYKFGVVLELGIVRIVYERIKEIK